MRDPPLRTGGDDGRRSRYRRALGQPDPRSLDGRSGGGRQVHGHVPEQRTRRGLTVDETIRQVLASHASVNVMLALEDAFDFEFSEKMLKKSTFESIEAIRAGVLEMTGG